MEYYWIRCTEHELAKLHRATKGVAVLPISSIEFLCCNPECRAKLEVGDDLAGKRVRCPKCKTVSVAQGNEQGGVAALDAFLEDKRVGRTPPYQTEKEIARGGMGAVILARDKAIQRELAVKVMRPQMRIRRSIGCDSSKRPRSPANSNTRTSSRSTTSAGTRKGTSTSR